jgi:hypothetical protein
MFQEWTLTGRFGLDHKKYHIAMALDFIPIRQTKFIKLNFK